LIEPEKPKDDTAGLTRYIQQILNRNDFLERRVEELLVANNAEMERRRLAEKEARRCRKALALVKDASRMQSIPQWVVNEIIDPALAGQDIKEKAGAKDT
jgi:hypothetical protein